MPDQLDDVRADLDFDDPPQELVEWARLNIREDPDTRAAAVQELRDMIYEKGDVEVHRTDDLFLVRFLRARHFHVENTYKLLVNYYRFKRDNPRMHKEIVPEVFRMIGDDGVVSVLPYREQTGRRILIYRLGDWDPSEYPVEDIFKVSVVTLELGIMEQRFQILGGICIFDFANLGLHHAWQITPTVASNVLQLMGGSFPIRIHAIHIVNQSWVFDMIFAMFKPLLQQKMKDKIFMHGEDRESLHQHIDPKFLPERYGGSRPEYCYMEWFNNLSAKEIVKENMNGLGYDMHDFVNGLNELIKSESS